MKALSIIGIILMFGCVQELDKPELNKDELEIVLKSNSDFSRFVELHANNAIVMVKLDETKRGEFSQLSNGNEVEKKKALEMLEQFGFNPTSVDYFLKVKNFLIYRYNFDQKDFFTVCVEQLNAYSISQKNRFGSRTSTDWGAILFGVCDIYCTDKANQVYPKSEGGFNLTANSIYYAGCMAGCGYAQP